MSQLFDGWRFDGSFMRMAVPPFDSIRSTQEDAAPKEPLRLASSLCSSSGVLLSFEAEWWLCHAHPLEKRSISTEFKDVERSRGSRLTTFARLSDSTTLTHADSSQKTPSGETVGSSAFATEASTCVVQTLNSVRQIQCMATSLVGYRDQQEPINSLPSNIRRHSRPYPESGRTLSSSIPTVRNQPSISTNSSSLNGSDTSTGGSIIMPMLIRTDEITMSITMNGR